MQFFLGTPYTTVQQKTASKMEATIKKGGEKNEEGTSYKRDCNNP